MYFQEVLVGLVAATVFKTVVRNDKSSAGGFDSHALPFLFASVVIFLFTVAEERLCQGA